MSYQRSQSTCREVEQIESYRQSLPGWRWALQTSRDLIVKLAMLKGAQEHRYNIQSLQHEIACSLAAGDMTVLRNTTATADMAIALAEADKAFPDGSWLMGRGRSQRRGGPAYGFAVFGATDGDTPIAEYESDDPRECVRQCVRQIEGRNAA